MSELKAYVLRGGVPENPDALRARIGELEEEIAPFRDPYFKGLSMEAIANLAKKSIKLTEQHNKDTERIGELEEALKKIGENPIYDENCDEWYNRDDVDFIIKEALKGAGK